MEQIKVISDFQKSKTLCPQCQGTNCIKRGKRRDKQRYQCKDCYRGFTENILTNPGKHIPAKYILPQNISAYEMKEYDTWDLRILGKNPAETRGYGVNFSEIYPNWLKQAAKDYIWSQVPRRETGTLERYVYTIKFISKFMQEFNFLHCEQIDREFVIDLIN
ncbi:MAG: hypothetical protein AB4368_23325 [Xenococcaceae cyanobacterium]